MTDLDLLDLALRIATLLVVTSSLGVAIAALRTVRAGIAAMTANAAQRAAEHDRRHAETLAALDAQRRATDQRDADSRRRHDETLAAFEAHRRATDQRDADSRRRHDETLAAFEAHRQALETLIARTAPAAD